MQVKQKITELIKHKGVINFFWLSADKVFKLFTALIIGSWTARYLGPSLLGKLNYILAYISILGAISTLGMEGFLVKEIIDQERNKNKILGTAFALRAVVNIVAIFIIALALYIQNKDQESFYLYFLLSVPILISPLDLIDIEFQSKLQSKLTVLSKNVGYIFGTILKIYFLIAHKSLVYFALVYIAEAVVSYFFLTKQYQKADDIRLWKYDRLLVRDLLYKAWPFMLASISVILYMKLDQIMLGNFLGDTAVGEFSSAVKIIEILLFIPMAISSSYLPILLKDKKLSEAAYIKSIKRLFLFSIGISLLAAILISLFSKYIILILYGIRFVEAKNVLSIYSWVLLPIFFGVASSQYLMVEGLQKFSFYRTLIGLIVNFTANLILIPKYGIIGAAIATLIAQITASYISTFLFTKTRILIYLQINIIKEFLKFKS